MPSESSQSQLDILAKIVSTTQTKLIDISVNVNYPNLLERETVDLKMAPISNSADGELTSNANLLHNCHEMIAQAVVSGFCMPILDHVVEMF